MKTPKTTEKQAIYSLIFAYIMAFICLLPFFSNSQTDSTTVAVNNTIQTIVLPGLFNILGSFGIKITPFAGLLTGIIMWIIRYFEKKYLKKQIAADIKSVVNSSNNLPASHENALMRLIHRIEGKKTN